MRPLLITVIILGFGYGLHRAALYAEYRGWIYYRTRPPRMRSLGLLEQLSDPSVEYRIEEQSSEAIRADPDSTGDPPAGELTRDGSACANRPWLP
jgi:hypothetical protein